MFTRLDEVDDVAERVIACAIEVHRTMGTGLLESIYQECVTLECRKQGLQLELEQIVPVHYKGTKLLSRFKIDVLVERCLVLEVKAVEAIRPVHKAQVISYLKLTGHPAGLLSISMSQRSKQACIASITRTATQGDVHPVPPSLKQIRFSDRRPMAGGLTPSATAGRVASSL